MFEQAEKAYCLALLALKNKDYQTAADYFDNAADNFKDNQEFNLLRETTRLLLMVKEESARLNTEDKIEIEEVLPYG